jgi:hypothetical protein
MYERLMRSRVVAAAAVAWAAAGANGRCVDISPVASLALEVELPWWPDSSLRIPIWPHQSTGSAARTFCEVDMEVDRRPSCATRLAAILQPQLDAAASTYLVRSIAACGTNDGATSDAADDATGGVGDDGSALEGAAALAPEVARQQAAGQRQQALSVSTAAAIASQYNPTALLSLNALMVIATALQRHDSPRFLAL